MKRFFSVLFAMLMMLAAVPVPALAQPPKDQLKAQFKAREAELRDLKQKGLVGETIDGYVDVVQPDAPSDEKVSRLVSDENKDRRQLYQILADEINKELPDAKVKATMETIATRNALRNIDKAGPDEYLRAAKDHWIRIKDFPRFQTLSTLKTQGRIGETSSGLVEIVKPEDRSDKALESTIKEENAARTAEYKALAEKERADVSAIVKRMAKRNFDNARIGDMLKDESGSWRKK